MQSNLGEKIIIATTTFYNSSSESDKLRAGIAKRTFETAIRLGYQIIAVDGGSSQELIGEFEKIGVKVSKQIKRGIGNSRRQAFQEAYNSKKEIIIWTEPEKRSIIKEISKIIKPIIENKADIVIPKRKSLSSYPLEQQYAESLGNLFWKQLTGTDLDMWIGVRAFRRESCSYFLNYNGEYGDKWEILLIPVINAIYDKKKVTSIEINYQHPVEQTRLEEKDLNFFKKRIEQLTSLVGAIDSHWKKLYNINL